MNFDDIMAIKGNCVKVNILNFEFSNHLCWHITTSCALKIYINTQLLVFILYHYYYDSDRYSMSYYDSDHLSLV